MYKREVGKYLYSNLLTLCCTVLRDTTKAIKSKILILNGDLSPSNAERNHATLFIPVIGRVEVMETIAEKRRRLARERYRRVQERLLDGARVPDAAVPELFPDSQITTSLELESKGEGRKKEKRRRRCIEKDITKRRKIKSL